MTGFSRARREHVGAYDGAHDPDEILIKGPHKGVAGQMLYTVEVPGMSRYVLVGTEYGTPGPVLMESADLGSVFVDSPERFGETFGRQWVERFARGRES